jgi:hypothetical protein
MLVRKWHHEIAALHQNGTASEFIVHFLHDKPT